MHLRFKQNKSSDKEMSLIHL